MLEARRAALPALSRLEPLTILEDATVPRSRIAEMVECIQEIAQRHDLKIGTFGHAGDGNLHPTASSMPRTRARWTGPTPPSTRSSPGDRARRHDHR